MQMNLLYHPDGNAWKLMELVIKECMVLKNLKKTVNTISKRIQ
jgi:hypothetical protein